MSDNTPILILNASNQATPVGPANPIPTTTAAGSLTNVNVQQVGGVPTTMSTADNVAGANVPMDTLGYFNGNTIDRARNNLDLGTLINAVAATTTQTSSAQFNLNGRGVKIVLNMATVGTGSVTLSLQGFDSASSQYYTMLSSLAITANGLTVYTLYPGIAVAANASASDILPRQWRIQAVANNANPTTYTVGAEVIL